MTPPRRLSIKQEVSPAYPTRLFARGVGRFFADRPFGEGFTCAQWIGLLVLYYDGRFIASVAFPFAALNMMRRRRAVGQSGRFLEIHVEDAPSNDAEIQGKLRACDVSFIDRARTLGGGWVTSRNRRLLGQHVRRGWRLTTLSRRSLGRRTDSFHNSEMRRVPLA